MGEQNRLGLGAHLARAGVATALLVAAHEANVFPFEDQEPPDIGVEIIGAVERRQLDPKTAEQYAASISREYDEVAQFWAARGVTLETSLDINFNASTDNACNADNVVAVGPYYCILNDTIYFSPEDLYFYERVTNTEPELLAEIIAGHEYGHAVQQSAQALNSDFELDNMARELQADCLAATAMTEHTADEHLDAEQAILELGDPNHWLHDHGTGAERVAAFREGLDGECPPMDGMLAAVFHAMNSAATNQ